MVNITHVLKDGTVLNSIAGHVVKAEEAEGVYDLLNRINQQQSGKRGAYETEKTQN